MNLFVLNLEAKLAECYYLRLNIATKFTGLILLFIFIFFEQGHSLLFNDLNINTLLFSLIYC